MSFFDCIHQPLSARLIIIDTTGGVLSDPHEKTALRLRLVLFIFTRSGSDQMHFEGTGFIYTDQGRERR